MTSGRSKTHAERLAAGRRIVRVELDREDAAKLDAIRDCYAFGTMTVSDLVREMIRREFERIPEIDGAD